MKPAASVAARVDAVDWPAVVEDLDRQGWAVVPSLLEAGECGQASSFWGEEKLFRSHVVMARHGYGRGAYRYFAYPLPPLVDELRGALYPRLAPLANAWHEKLNIDTRFPAEHASFLARCHRAGQKRPTPLLLEYGEGDYNCLHQDLYGDHVFPIQVAILLDVPGADFSGGEFIITEQRPRRQTAAAVVPLGKGDAVIFAVNFRPVAGARGFHRVTLRHGVSTLRAGHRHTLGIIFHDAV